MSDTNVIDDGGSAFPVSFSSNHPTEMVGGLTKREYIAIKAMQACLMNDAMTDNCDTSSEWLDKVSAAAYEIADKMLKAGTK